MSEEDKVRTHYYLVTCPGADLEPHEHKSARRTDHFCEPCWARLTGRELYLEQQSIPEYRGSRKNE